MLLFLAVGSHIATYVATGNDRMLQKTVGLTGNGQTLLILYYEASKVLSV